MTDLKPCPFCGSDVDLFKKKRWLDPVIWCAKCNLYIESMQTVGPKTLAEAWNRRVSE